MAETYCGKSCAQCQQKELLSCPGCKPGPGRTYGGDCELAKCARTKGHETCDTCTTKGNCGHLRGCQHFPEYRRRKQEAETQRQVTLARQVPLYGKWLWILFWLVIPSTVAGLMGNETLGQTAPGIYVLGEILTALCSVAYGLILLKLAAEQDIYRTAGICSLIGGGLGFLMAILTRSFEKPVLILLLAIPALIVGLVREYNEYMGHSAIVEGLNNDLSQKWQNLWKWFLGCYAGLFGSLVVMVLIPFLGALGLLAAAIGILVVAILKLVYLYRTAKFFREYTTAQSN